MDICNKKVHFLGDSITERYSASVYENCFVGLFQSAYPNAEITNYGIGGSRIARQINSPRTERHDRDFNMRVADMSEDADLIVVFGGTNDYGHGNAPFGAWGDKTDDTFCGAVYALYEKLANKYPLAKFLVLTPLHRLNEDTPDMKGKILKEYVDIIRKTAEYFSYPVLDLYAVSGMNPSIGKMKDMMMNDGLHPNDNGHKRLFETIDAYIKSCL